VFVARQVARARLDLGVACSKETQQRPESVARFRRTGRKAAVDGGLSRTDGLVGMAQLEVGECVYRDDTPAVTDVLSHRHTHTHTQTHIYTEQPFTTLSNQRCTVVARIYSGSFGPVRSLVGILH